MRLFQIWDTVANAPVGPITTSNREEAAVREFTDLLRDEKTRLHNHPADFELRCLGEQDDETGTIVVEINDKGTVNLPYQTPYVCLRGADWAKGRTGEG